MLRSCCSCPSGDTCAPAPNSRRADADRVHHDSLVPGLRYLLRGCTLPAFAKMRNDRGTRMLSCLAGVEENGCAGAMDQAEGWLCVYGRRGGDESSQTPRAVQCVDLRRYGSNHGSSKVKVDFKVWSISCAELPRHDRCWNRSEDVHKIPSSISDVFSFCSRRVDLLCRASRRYCVDFCNDKGLAGVDG